MEIQLSKKDKIKLLKSIAAGKGSITELLPVEKYITLEEDGVYYVSHWISKQVTVMQEEQYQAWAKERRKIKTVDVIDFLIRTTPMDERDEPIKD